MSYIDPYLLLAFEFAEEQAEIDAKEGHRPFVQSARLPMLVQVTDDFWRREHVPDLQITSRIGNIISCRGSHRTLDSLYEDPAVVYIEGSRRALPLDTAQSLQQVQALTAQRRYSEDGSGCIVAVIDDGIDFLHRAFQDDNGNTRILEIWDQTHDSQQKSPNFTYTSGLQSHTVRYGTIYTKADIDSYVQYGSVPSRLGRNPGGHGTHVASIAAGRATGTFMGGVAPGAMLLVVIPKLEAGKDDPWSVGYSTSYMDALAYISHFVRKYSQRQGMSRTYPVVVNVSQGMNAGAHDGTSLVEAAFDSFSESGRAAGLVIVKAAGNTRDKYIHANPVMSPYDHNNLQWHCEHDHVGPDVVEVWFKSCDDLTFSLTEPMGETLRKKASWAERSFVDAFASGNVVKMVLKRYHPDNGDSCLLVMVKAGSRQSIMSGDWTLGIESKAIPLGGEVHAWLDRDDRSSVQFKNHINERVTLSIPGTARSVICVAAVNSTGGLNAISTPTYSAYGKTRDGRNKPDLAAPGHNILAAKAGTLDGAISKDGTSMAAPHVTGAIALVMSLWARKNKSGPHLTANQIRAALTQGTQNFNPSWDEKRGYGILDVATLVESFL